MLTFKSGELKNCKLVVLVNYDLCYFALTGLFQWIPDISVLGCCCFGFFFLLDLSNSLEKLLQSPTERLSLAATILVAKCRKNVGLRVSVLLMYISLHPIFSTISMPSTLPNAQPHSHLDTFCCIFILLYLHPLFPGVRGTVAVHIWEGIQWSVS